jgi:Zn-dependent protease
MLNNSPVELIAGVITLLIAFTFHEFSHAWTATHFGDDTPRQYGRLTLNPLSHLDMLGSLMLLLTGFGWAKPVPINPSRLRQHSRAALMLVALSGPAANLALAILAAIPLRFGWVVSTLPIIDFFPTPYQFLIYFLFTNLGLMLFNLIPVPPLDGDEVLSFFLPPEMQRSWDKVRPYGPYILLILLFLGPFIGLSLIDKVLRPAILYLAQLLLGGF